METGRTPLMQTLRVHGQNILPITSLKSPFIPFTLFDALMSHLKNPHPAFLPVLGGDIDN
jgi:hypothetical protein